MFASLVAFVQLFVRWDHAKIPADPGLRVYVMPAVRRCYGVCEHLAARHSYNCTAAADAPWHFQVDQVCSSLAMRSPEPRAVP